MPKQKTSVDSKIDTWLRDLDTEKVFQKHDDSVFCRACGKLFKCSKKCHILQHQRAPSHRANERKTERQTLLNDRTLTQCSDRTNFNAEMCQAFVAANIPLHKLKNKTFSSFLEKYCQQNIPDESTLRKNYIPKCYQNTMKKIRKYIGEENIWLAVDETTDFNGRFVAHAIVGKLSKDEPSIPLLLASKELERTNNITISRFVNDSLAILWPNGIKHDRLKLYATDGAAYMLKSAINLKIFYPNLLHVTCLAHALNLVCEAIRHQSDDINILINNTKKIFLKAPLRVQVYKELLPDCPLPPEPVLTRWGTWIEAAIFYAKYYEKIKEVVMTFGAADSEAIRRAQEIFKEKNLQNKLFYVQCHFEILVSSIKKLETVGMTLDQSIDVVDSVFNALRKAPGQLAEVAFKKLDQLLKKNPGYETLKQYKNLLCGEVSTNVENINWIDFKYAPLTSCDVERSFSNLKNVLTDNRNRFTPENLEQYLVCQANAELGN